MNNEAKLINIRGRMKAAMTRTQKWITAEDSSHYDSADLQVRLERLENAFHEAIRIDTQLPDEISEVETIEEQYFSTKAAIKKVLDCRDGARNIPPPRTDALQAAITLLAEQQRVLSDRIGTPLDNIIRQGSDYQLPRLNIERFNGDYGAWKSFKDLFSSAIHNNAGLSSVFKFQQLKGLLGQDAAALIRHIPVSEENYQIAWEKLCQRYEKKKHIAQRLVQTFMELPRILHPDAAEIQRVADISDEVIRSLETVDQKASSRDLWLIHLLLEKMDPETRLLWAQQTAEVDFPAFEDFIKFINSRANSLEVYNPHTQHNKTKPAVAHLKGSSNKCPKCNGTHPLFKCFSYKALPLAERKIFVKRNSLCFNCLGSHLKKNCASSYVCNICKQNHHSSLHEDIVTNLATPMQDRISQSAPTALENPTPVPVFESHVSTPSVHVALLPTAQAYVLDSSGNKVLMNILLDSGSQCSFASESCVQKLGLQRENARFIVKGLAASNAGTTKGFVKLKLFSIHNDQNNLSIKSYILNKITAPLPSQLIPLPDLDYLNSIHLADINFNKPKNVDILIGADYFFQLIRSGQIYGSNNDVIAQNTLFGFVLSGNVSNLCTNSLQTNTCTIGIHSETNIDKTLKLFWESEEIPTKNNGLNPEEEFCEKHFKETFTFNSDGRFVVKLPFIKSTELLGNSKPAAISRFLNMERKFMENSELGNQYKQFMAEYEALGHMVEVKSENVILDNSKVFYLPHHGVFKPSSTTSKLRVVFDGSCNKASNSTSLNSILGIGNVLQNDIFSILLKFRVHEIALSSDIEKMYRQVLIDTVDQNYQRIIWRSNPNSKLKEYQLCTVTYGISSSSFLATRSLFQVALDCNYDSPIVSNIIKNDIYVDDVLTGFDNLQTAVTISSQLKEILESRGFHLRKWRSNSSQLIDALLPGERETSCTEICEDDCSKVLGLLWDSTSDNFIFKVGLHIEGSFTKRSILSQSSRLFDPLGLLSPCTIMIKIFYQQLWLERLDWDDILPPALQKKWAKFQEEFNCLQVVKIPRWLHTSDSNIELHGFSDASEHAFSSVIYCRQRGKNNEIKVSILCAKTKVAPIQQVSIPRLELNGALLLARLMKLVLSVFKDYNVRVQAWCDSKVVLAWLASHPRRWKTFIGNRTSEILDIISYENWHYVQSKHNPADVASRGISPSLLADHHIWWNGPPWLAKHESEWPIPVSDIKENNSVLSEEKALPLYSMISNQSNDVYDEMFIKYSSLSKITRILSYCIKFIRNCKIQSGSARSTCMSTQNEISIPLSLSEENDALNLIISYVQRKFYADELKCIEKGKSLNQKSSLIALSPFIDSAGILRVGGRLQNSSLNFDSKHPIILPRQHEISTYLVKQYHVSYLHAGPTVLISILRHKFWIVGVRRLIQSVVHQCITCCRFRADTSHQLMGNLPTHRVTMSRPFLACGIDYAGPIKIKLHKGRGARITKGYIALFICFSTKAVHIEAVSDLSADAFIAALRRFSSRRNSPKHIYSDNATNFVGAKRRLSEIQRITREINKDASVAYFLNQSFIEWHMIAPASPHLGGIWESGIRSVKFHLRRVIGDTSLTFEELTTLLTQIEAVLNSRPLTVTSENDINSLDVLTPSHFLIGESITSPPELKVDSNKLTYHTRWELIQKLKQAFWKKWHHEYLNTLQQRNMWRNKQRLVTVGDLVLLREDNTPPAAWPLGRIVDTHPGKDNIVRVVTVKTAKGLFKRSIVKLCILPIYHE